MSPLTLEYAPVLTPRTIADLDGRLSCGQREDLLALVRQSIKSCFAPFARGQGKEPQAFADAVRGYLPYRLWILQRLVAIVSADLLPDLLRGAMEALATDTGWEEIGLSSSRMGGAFRRYAKAAGRLLCAGHRLTAWGPQMTDALHRLIEGSVWVATELDFTLTALALCRDKQIAIRPNRLRFLAGSAPRIVRRYETHVATLCRHPAKLTDYFIQLMMERGLLVPTDEKPLERPAGFHPVPIRGEPASVTLLADRR